MSAETEKRAREVDEVDARLKKQKTGSSHIDTEIGSGGKMQTDHSLNR